MKWLAPAAVVVLAVLFELTLGRATGAPDFAFFFGRFHPLVVHLPIGFFLLVALGEAATLHPALRGRVEPALGLLVPVSAVAALLAFLMGQLLSLEGGFPAQSLTWHRRLTLLAVLGMAACWVAFERQHERGGQGRWVYRGLMGATLGVLSLGAHFGGTMTRGEGYLSKYAPGPLKPLLGSAEEPKPKAESEAKAGAPSADPLVYQDVLAPILERHCVECHGPEKQKGKLRLDSLGELRKGGENGPVVVAGDAKRSPLLARMLLPLDDDERMPPEGKPAPKPEELALLEFWIERGAVPTLKVRDLLAPSVSRALLERALAGVTPRGDVPVSAPPRAPGDAAGAAAAGADPSAAAATAATASGAAARAATESAPATRGATADASGASAAGVSEREVSADSTGALVAPAEPGAPLVTAGARSGPAFLALHCEKCHGAAKQKGKLRVDSVAALLEGGAGGAALVPGSPEQSSIVQRLRLPLSDDEHMPPKKEPQPTPAEVAVLVAWIRAGAGSAGATPAVSAKAAPRASVGAAGAALAEPPQGIAGEALAPRTAAAAADSPSPPVAAASMVAPSVAPSVAGTSDRPDAALLASLPSHVALFSEAVQPLLAEKCGNCHIKDKPAGGLGVAKHAELLEGGYSGAAIVPKDRRASSVMQRLVMPPSDDEHMPPAGEPQLDSHEIELIGAWIDQGAPAAGVTEVAKLTAGAARALQARGVRGQQPPPAVSTQAGGCGACSVPGAPQSRWLALQAATLVGAALLAAGRRRRRDARRR